MEKTIFEKILDKEIPGSMIYEDEHSFAILDIKPKKLGHTLVITKKPFRNMLEIEDSVMGNYFNSTKKVSNAIKKALNCDGLNIIINIEPAGGQEVFHAHTHIIPRFINDKLDLNPGEHENYKNEEEMEDFKNKIISAL